MKTTKFLIVVGIAVIFSQAFAQDPKRTNLSINDDPVGGESNNQQEVYSGALVSTQKLEGTAGNPYLYRDWHEGIIIMKDKSVITGNKFRYNIYSQQMEFIDNNDTMAIANPEETKLIRFADKVFVYTDYYYKSELSQGYFELLEDGPCMLLKRWVISYHLTDNETQQRNVAANDSEEFVKECNCYLKFGNIPATTLENHKKDFINCFDEDSEQISAYMKRGKLKHKDQGDLLEIVSYYNEIHQ